MYVLPLCQQSITNTFQGILISDGETSYAVFIYECGGMEWSGGVIGWQASSSDYEAHSLSGDSDNDDIGCRYSSSYSAVVYPICKRRASLYIHVINLNHCDS